MADAKKCDECGCLYEINDNITSYKTHRKVNYKFPRVVVSFSMVEYDGDAQSADFCDTCKRKLLKETGWFKEEKIVEKG